MGPHADPEKAERAMSDAPAGGLEAMDDFTVSVARVACHYADPPELQKARLAGRGDCLCPISTIERVVRDHGTCGQGGCPYGGDI